MERNPNISLRKAEGLSSVRCSGLNREDVMEYFSLLRKTIEEFELMDKSQMIYSADESGCPLHNTIKEGIRQERKQNSICPDMCRKRRFVTILACANAIGNFIPLMAIFKGKKHLPEFGDGWPNGSLVTMTESGWINKENFLMCSNIFTLTRFLDPAPYF
ncbi:hypothetical protein ANN_13768 [Periplaneta americana]|uniref:DDE-1 domain-containing protein n=1 Tax=Periplaneta americana TaxID=6978 RepID=A0ABQ8SUF6_PERAM|nr:hypothetical protein ANN_13768 [Periplaneta americana]